jgi:hypothetical protein
MQSGVSALAGGTPELPAATGITAQQQASTQTVLSAVALALDAIQRSGGEATPAVVGTAPVWPTPQQVQAAADGVVIDMLATLADELAADVSADVADATLTMQAGAEAGAAGAPQAGGAGAAAGAAQAGAGAEAGNAAAQSGAAATTDASATTGANAAAQAAGATQAGPADPVAAALAQSLQRTVAGSGLFYESHLAQWLLGQRSPAELAAEPQNRLVASLATQLPLDWRRGAGQADDVFWTDPHAPDAPPQPADAARAAAARSANPAQAALFDDLLDVVSPPPFAQSAQPGAAAASGDAAALATNAQGQPFALHPAVIPLLRQQLDVLATGEFRWNGEAWPGARLDWSIRQDDDARRGHPGSDADAMAWRTRLTLSLPSLGIVDAELTLVGATLAVRVQASGDGAARLAENGEALRGRMAAAGIELGALAIREVGGAVPVNAGPEAARAAHAYASAATAATAGAQAGSNAAASSDAMSSADEDRNGNSTGNYTAFDWEAPR